ncbi:MAG TPA: glycosyltransferase family 4 protein [Treponema sp.]|nr:glycosyltransferase family 4 protein [Treponema sp.]
MKKLQIAMLSSFYFPHVGGTERYVHDLSYALAKRGHRVTIFSHFPGPVKQDNEDLVQVVRIPAIWGPAYSPILAPQSKKLLAAMDIIHSHAPPFYFLNHAARLRDKPQVLTYHCDIEIPERIGVINLPEAPKRLIDTYFNQSTRLHLKKVDTIVTTTKTYAETSETLKGFTYTVIPIGIHTETFKKHLEQCQEEGCVRKEHEILFVGRLVASKGLWFLLEAMEILKNRGQTAHLTIVGNGEELLALKLFVSSHNLEHMVSFAGQVDDDTLFKLYSSASIFILPSFVRLEAFGIVQLEALSMGVPVIASDIPGVNEVVRKSGGGWLVPPMNSQALADQIQYALQHREERLERARKGQKYVYINNDWSVISEQFENLYYQTIEQKKHKDLTND